MDDLFFPPFNTADMARPRVDDFCQAGKKKRGENGKSWNPLKNGGFDGLQMIFSFWKKTGDSLGSDLRFRVST